MLGAQESCSTLPHNWLTYRAPSDVALLQLPEPVPFRACLVDLPQRDVHEVVAVDKVSVERFSILKFDQLRGRGCAAISLHAFSLRETFESQT